MNQQQAISHSEQLVGVQAPGSFIPAPPPPVQIQVQSEGGAALPPIFYYNFDDPKLEKKWSNPREDITDYFNYGMNEDTWKIYANKVKDLAENSENWKDKDNCGCNVVDTSLPIDIGGFGKPHFADIDSFGFFQILRDNKERFFLQHLADPDNLGIQIQNVIESQDFKNVEEGLMSHYLGINTDIMTPRHKPKSSYSYPTPQMLAPAPPPQPVQHSPPLPPPLPGVFGGVLPSGLSQVQQVLGSVKQLHQQKSLIPVDSQQGAYRQPTNPMAIALKRQNQGLGLWGRTGQNSSTKSAREKDEKTEKSPEVHAIKPTLNGDKDANKGEEAKRKRKGSERSEVSKKSGRDKKRRTSRTKSRQSKSKNSSAKLGKRARSRTPDKLRSSRPFKEKKRRDTRDSRSQRRKSRRSKSKKKEKRKETREKKRDSKEVAQKKSREKKEQKEKTNSKDQKVVKADPAPQIEQLNESYSSTVVVPKEQELRPPRKLKSRSPQKKVSSDRVELPVDPKPDIRQRIRLKRQVPEELAPNKEQTSWRKRYINNFV